jgi:hypothetical protein
MPSAVGRIASVVSAFLANMSLWLRMEDTRNLAALSMLVLSFADVSNLVTRARTHIEKVRWTGLSAEQASTHQSTNPFASQYASREARSISVVQRSACSVPKTNAHLIKSRSRIITIITD